MSSLSLPRTNYLKDLNFYEAHHCEYENHVQIIRRFINSFSKLCTMKTEEIKIDKKNRKKRKETFEIGDN